MRWIDKDSVLWGVFKHLQRRQYDYQIVFRNAQPIDENVRAGCARRVVLDLMRFCHAEASTLTERQQGRREVWLYVNRFLHLDPEELTVLQAGLSLEDRYALYNPEAPTLIDGA
jgi:hypothetical protein